MRSSGTLVSLRVRVVLIEYLMLEGKQSVHAMLRYMTCNWGYLPLSELV